MLVVKQFAREIIEKFRPFIPPVAEQFGVVGRHGERGTIQKSRDALDLHDTFVEKMAGVFGGGLQCRVALINFLVPCSAGDAVIFDAGEPAVFRRRQMRFHIIEIEIKADIAVKIAVTRIAGITLVLAPNLPRGIEVAPECGDAVGRKNRRKGAVTRAWTRMQYAMRVENEPADVGFL